jgi:hypothetical protein
MINKTVRGNRSNLVITECYDTETKEWCTIELDLRDPITRYIPEYFMQQYGLDFRSDEEAENE